MQDPGAASSQRRSFQDRRTGAAVWVGSLSFLVRTLDRLAPGVSTTKPFGRLVTRPALQQPDSNARVRSRTTRFTSHLSLVGSERGTNRQPTIWRGCRYQARPSALPNGGNAFEECSRQAQQIISTSFVSSAMLTIRWRFSCDCNRCSRLLIFLYSDFRLRQSFAFA